VIPKVPAYLQVLHVDDNSKVRAGELIVELDPRDYQAQVDIAQANLEAAQGRLGEAQQSVAVAQSQTRQDLAEQKVAQANATLGAINLHRLQSVTDSRAVAPIRIDEATASANATRSTFDAATVKVKTSQAQTTLAQAQQKTAIAAVAQARAQLAQAQLNLSYTKIYSTDDGTVANKTAEAGNYVQPGQLLFSVVPDRVYIVANYKETQLTHVRPGQPATVTVDAFPGVRLHGHVDSLQRGTGARFALLPPENATGNFVKVVQRVPVKIVLDEPARALRWISPGMSVETRIQVDRGDTRPEGR
jgi:membrane fusion protein, multidrug efflux system